MHAEPVVADYSTMTIPSKTINNYLTSWVGNDGGTPATHVPHTMENMYVRGDGLVAAICHWDEGGSNVTVYRDGKLINAPSNSGTGGWGRHSGKAVVLDGQYTYQLMTQSGGAGAIGKNANGLPTYPASGFKWHVVRRYDANTGASAPFSSGYGFANDMLFITENTDTDANPYLNETVGLAVNTFSNELFVVMRTSKGSNVANYIYVYNKATMNTTYKRRLKIEGEVGHISLDAQWGLWMRRGNKIVRLSQLTGEAMGPEIVLPEGNYDFRSFSVDGQRGKLYVANSGRDLNVLIYDNIYNTPVLADTTIGTRYGFLSTEGGYKKGEVGPLRFTGPTGVGVDDTGNIYVSSTVVGGYGATLEAYSPELEFLWKTEGLFFTAVGDFHPSDSTIVYTPEKIHKVDYMKMGHRMDELVAYTHDPFSYPDDPRDPDNGTFVTCSFAREIEGKIFTFVSDMYSGMLHGYRYDEATHGYTGVPFMGIWPSNFWLDLNGDGLQQAGEVTKFTDLGGSNSIFIDQDGNIWRGSQSNGFTLWEFDRLNANGCMTWKAQRDFAFPKGITSIRRIFYLPERDELFLGGFSNEKPAGSGSAWWALGSSIVKYSNAMSLINGTTPPSAWEPSMSLYVPFVNTDSDVNSRAIAVADNLLCVGLFRKGYVLFFDSETGEYKGMISPGSEAGQASGWMDFNYALNVRKNKNDNTYSLLVEENGYAKVLFYDLFGFNTEAATRLGDLNPLANSVTFKDAQSATINSTDVGIGQPVYFGVTVRNRVANFIVGQYNRYNPARCIVQFTVQDTNTGEVVFTGYSKAHEQDIAGGEELLLSSEEPFIPEAGSYRLTVDVNYGRWGKEANYNNNTITADFSASTVGLNAPSGQSVSIYPNPVVDRFTIAGIEASSNTAIELYSLDGLLLQRISSSGKNSVELNMGGYASGAYLLRIQTDNNCLTQKVVKK